MHAKYSYTSSVWRTRLVAMFAVLLCAALGALGLQSLPYAQAAGPLTVSVQAVHPQSYAVLDNQCGITATTKQNIGYGVIANNLETQSYSNGACSYVRAVYKGTDGSYLEISKLEPGSDSSTVIVTPVVPDGQAAAQSKVVLSMPLAEVTNRIFLQYGPNSEALPLTFTPAGGAATVATLDATALSAERTVRVSKDSSGAYTYDFTVEVPRERSLSVTSGDADATVSLVQDDSTTTKTVRRYRVTYPSGTDKSTTKTVTVTASTGNKTIAVRGRSLQSNRTAGTNVFEYADDCGGVSYTNKCASNATEPASGSHGFFYSVLDTASNTIGKYDGIPNSGDHPLAHRYGISGVNPSTKVFWSGWDNLTYQQPAFDNSKFNGADNWDTSVNDSAQREEQARSQSVVPSEINVANQAYGNGKVEFYVQNNGMSASPMVSANVKGKHSYFISAVRVNGQVLQVPFPTFTSQQIMSNTFDEDTNQWQKYKAARDDWLGAKTQVNTFPKPMHQLSNDCRLMYTPRQYAQYKLTTGPNAGSTVTVEMVNARLVGDYLADGYSVGWKTGGSWNQYGWSTDDSQMKRHHYVWFNGPAMQMLDNSVCVATTRGDDKAETYVDDGVKVGPRHSPALDNQWKTMYRVTIDGMSADAYNVDVIWGITSQGFVQNAGGQVLDDEGRVTLKRERGRADEVLAAPLPENAAALQNPFNSSGDKTGLEGTAVVRQYCQNESDPNCYVSLATSGNAIRVHVKDGYVKPKVEMAVLGQNTSGQDATNRVVKDMVQLKTVDSSYVNDPSAFGADMSWPENISKKFTRTVLGGTYDTVIGLSRQVNLSFNGTTVNVPVLYLANSLTTQPLNGTPYVTSSDKPVLASSDVVPSQWSGQNGALSPQWVNKTDAAYQQVQGAIPTSPEPGKVFVGYKAYGVKFSTDTTTDLTAQAAAKTQNGDTAAVLIEKDQKSNQLFGKNLFPGETIDVAGTYPDGSARVRLSNDDFTAARVDAVWMVPQFAAGGSDSAYYTARNVVKNADGSTTPINTAFTFVGAAGLTATVAADYQPSKTLAGPDGATYTHSGPDTRTAVLSTDRASGIEFVYEPDASVVVIDKTWSFNRKTYPDGAQPAQFTGAPSIDGAEGVFGESMKAAPFTKAFTLAETATVEDGYTCKVTSATVYAPGSNTPLASLTPTAGNNGKTWTASTNVPNTAPGTIAGTAGDTVTISYAFASADVNRPDLPAEVTRLETDINANIAYTKAKFGDMVSPPAISTNRVEDPNGKGVWIFDGWAKSVVSATRSQTITGRWSYHVETPVPTTFAVNYRWSLPTGLTGNIPETLTSSLPDTRIYDGNNAQTATKPQNPSSPINTSNGKLVFETWQLNGTTWEGSWKLAPKHSIKYVWKVLQANATPVTVDSNSYIGKLLSASIPANETDAAIEGQVVRPAAMRNYVVNYRSNEIAALGGDWGSLQFEGWDVSDTTVGTGDVTFTAIFRVKSSEWKRAVVLTNQSSTNTQTANNPKPVVIPASIERQMQAAMASSATEKLSGTWKAPDWSTVSFRDDINHGYWTFNKFTYKPKNTGTARDVPTTGIAVDANNFPMGPNYPNGSTQTDENIYSADGGTTVKNLSLNIQGLWNFRADPVYTINNTVTCTSSITLKKAIGAITNGLLPLPAGEESKYTKKIEWKYNGNGRTQSGTGDVTVPDTANAGAFQGVHSATLSESSTSAANPAFAHQKWQCTVGTLDSADTTNGSATLAFGDGVTSTCTVTNTASEITLLASVTGQGTTSPGNVTVTATPTTGQPALPTLSASDQTKRKADVANTFFARPGRNYTLTATASTGTLRLKGFERYTGSTPNDSSILDTNAWEAVSGVSGGSGTAVGTSGDPVVTLTAGTHEVYRAVYEPQPYTAVLPKAGGLGRDAFLLAGFGALFLGAAAATVHRRRKAAHTHI